jgi:hypothetical protein
VILRGQIKTLPDVLGDDISFLVYDATITVTSGGTETSQASSDGNFGFTVSVILPFSK